MKRINTALVFLLCFPSLTTTAFAAVRRDVTTCTSPGADPTGITDSASAIQACLDGTGSEAAAIYFPPGTYKIGSTLTVGANYTTLYSDSWATARLQFAGCGDLVRYQKAGGGISFNGGIRGLWLSGDGHCSQTAVHLVDTSWMVIEDSPIYPFNDSLEGSVGIKTEGREGFNLRNVQIQANMPMVLGQNPNNPYLDVDHFHFENVYSIVKGTVSQHWHITLENGVVVTSMTVDGQNPFVGGCGVLKWITTTPAPPSVSSHLRLANIRHEQMSSGCDKQIDIEQNSSRPLYQLIIDNVRLEGPYPTSANAIYTNYVNGISVRDTSYPNNAAPNPNNANFINANNALWIELNNNYVTPYGGKVKTSPIGAWKAGPYRGKDCCDPPGTRTLDSGVWGAVP